MVVHRKRHYVFAVIERERLVIFHVLKNENVLSAHAFQKFGLEFAVHKIRESRLDFENRLTIFVGRVSHRDVRCVDIAFKIDFFYKIVFVDLVTSGYCLVF